MVVVVVVVVAAKEEEEELGAITTLKYTLAIYPDAVGFLLTPATHEELQQRSWGS